LAAALQEKKGTFTRLLLPVRCPRLRREGRVLTTAAVQKGNFDEGQRQHLRGIDSRIEFG
jgi:hypothetical protein